jgi:hypothetical protein
MTLLLYGLKASKLKSRATLAFKPTKGNTMARGRKIRPFGTYNAPELPWGVDCYDVAECQERVPKGARIRNKKAKRRQHNKRTRSVLLAQTREELNQTFFA